MDVVRSDTFGDWLAAMDVLGAAGGQDAPPFGAADSEQPDPADDWLADLPGPKRKRAAPARKKKSCGRVEIDGRLLRP